MTSRPLTVVTELLGSLDEERYFGREVDQLVVSWADASKRRLRAKTEAGRDLAIDLPRRAYLRAGAVLVDDDEAIVVVARKAEPALVVRLDSAAQGALIGHAFGNQHVPIEVVEDEIRVPITTSAELMTRTVQAVGGSAEVREVALWPDSPPTVGHHEH